MASRRLALIGCAEGPWVDISRVPRPILVVKGLKEGVVDATLKTSGGDLISLGVSANGEIPLFDGSFHSHRGPFFWIKVCASKVQRSLICEIISGKAA